jgi:hypothetical protein
MSSFASPEIKEVCNILNIFSSIEENKENTKRKQDLLLEIQNNYSEFPFILTVLKIYDLLKDHKVEIRFIFLSNTFNIIINDDKIITINVDNVYDLICMLLMFSQPHTNKLADNLYMRLVCQFRETFDRYTEFFEFLIQYGLILNLEHDLRLYPISIGGKIKNYDFFRILNNATDWILLNYAELKKHIPIIVEWMKNVKNITIDLDDCEDE